MLKGAVAYHLGAEGGGVPPPHAHCMLTACSLHTYCMLTACSLHTYCMLTACSLRVHAHCTYLGAEDCDHDGHE